MRILLLCCAMLNISVSAQGPMFKALELFKKNQWSVNKMLKKNQLLAKERADRLENIISEQNSIIKMLQNKLDVVERKVNQAPSKPAEIDDLVTKVSTIEVRLQKLSDAEHADFTETDNRPLNLLVNNKPLMFNDMPLTPIVVDKEPREPEETPVAVKRPVPAVKAPQVPVQMPRSTRIPVRMPQVSVPVLMPKPRQTTVPSSRPFTRVPHPNSPAAQLFKAKPILIDEAKTETPPSAGGSLLDRMKNRAVSMPKPTSPPADLIIADGESCVNVPSQNEVGAVVQSSWYNGGSEQLTAKVMVSLPVPMSVPDNASMLIHFNAPVVKVEVWECSATAYTEDNKVYLFSPHNKVALAQNAGSFFKFDFIVTVAAGEVKMELQFCRDLIEQNHAPFQAEQPVYDYEPEPAVEEKDEIMLDYSILAPKANLPAAFAHLVNNRPAVARPVISSARPALPVPSSSSSNSDNSRCRGSMGIAPSRPSQTDATNFTAATDDELAIFGYDLNELIHKSILFYEAQRAGPLPSTNRIPWRGDSTMRDGCDIGVDLSRGWFDAGDHVKFTFPAAYTATMLAWSVIDSKDGYQAAGEYDNALDQVRWGLEWLIKAHVSPNELVVMVGDPDKDHGVWTRAEDLRMQRPTYTVNQRNGGGTEPAAEAAAALAAGSVMFKDEDPEFAALCLSHAKQLLQFADQNRKNYHVTVPKVAKFYKSWNGYEDELCWATAWMYKATNETAYMRLAMHYYDKFDCGKVEESFDWDKKQAGVQLLMAQTMENEQLKQKYRNDVERYANHLLDRQKTGRTGQLYVHKWGTLRLANNFGAFLIGASRLEPRLKRADEYFLKGIEQLGIALGDTGRSFVQGFGVNPPLRSHHRSASCSATQCSENGHQPNQWILYGAMVGGPDINGQYTDRRNDYVNNEVAIDYNAAYQYSLAAAKTVFVEEIKRANAT